MVGIKDILRDCYITKCEKEITQEERLKTDLFFKELPLSHIIYRYIGDSFLMREFNVNTNNIEILSKHIFLYGDKGKLFYEDLQQKSYIIDFAEIEKKNFSFIYNKMCKVFVNTNSLKSEKTKDALSKFACFNEVKSFFLKVSLEDWLARIEKLCVEDKTILKNYYISFLHTVGSAGFGNNTYFLSTSSDFNFCNKLLNENRINNIEDGIIITGWTGKQNYIRTSGKKNGNKIRKLGFPVLDYALFPDQHEITLMCGLLPHFIIGYIYKDKFEVNPFIFKVENMKKAIKEGLPVNQKDFIKNISDTNIKSFYNICDGFYWQQ